jgi:hypothetical protein
METVTVGDSGPPQPPQACPRSLWVYKKHKCTVCDYRSNHRWLVRRHEKSQHKQSSTVDGGVAVPSTAPTNDTPALVVAQPDQSAELVDNARVVVEDPQTVGGEAATNNDVTNMEVQEDGQSVVPQQQQPLPPPPSNTNATIPPLSTPLQQQKPRKSGVIISADGGTIKNSIEEIEGPVDKRIIEDFKIFPHGPSRSGKSTWTRDMLLNLDEIATKVPELTIYAYAKWQKAYDTLLAEGLVDYFVPGSDKIEEAIDHFTNGKSALIIFDDQINSETTTAYAARLFTVDARHSGKSCIWITQNAFGGGKMGTLVRSIRMNADYIILFKCPGDCLSIQTLSKQMTGGPLLYNIHQYVTSKDPYSYLMVDITQASEERLKFTSHLFDQPGVMRVYVPQMK